MRIRQVGAIMEQAAGAFSQWSSHSFVAQYLVELSHDQQRRLINSTESRLQSRARSCEGCAAAWPALFRRAALPATGQQTLCSPLVSQPKKGHSKNTQAGVEPRPLLKNRFRLIPGRLSAPSSAGVGTTTSRLPTSTSLPLQPSPSPASTLPPQQRTNA